MAEIITPDELKSINDAAGGLELVLKNIQGIIKSGKAHADAIRSATSTAEIKKLIDALVGEQKALEQTQEKMKGVAESTSMLGEELKNATGPFGEFIDNAQQAGQKVVGLIKGFADAARASKLLSFAMKAIPIIALVGAITSLIAYFRKSADGAEKFRKIMAVLEEIFSAFVDVLIAAGRALANLSIDKVKQGFKDFGETIKQFVLSRIELLLGGIKGIGTAFKLLFKGDFKGAAKEAGQAFIDLQRATNPLVIAGEVLVEGYKAAAEAAVDFYNNVKSDAIAALDLQERENALMRARREFILQEAQLLDQLAEARERAADTELNGAERLKANAEAVRIVTKLEEARLGFAREELSIEQARMALGEVGEEQLKHEKQLQAEIYNIQAEGSKEMRTLNKERTKIQREITAAEKKAAEERKKNELSSLDTAIKGAKSQAEARIAEAKRSLDYGIAAIKQEAIAGRLTREEADKAILDLQKKTSKALIDENVAALQQQLADFIKFTNQKMLVAGVTEAEAARIRQEQVEEEAKVNAAIAKLNKDAVDLMYGYLADKRSDELIKTEEFLTKVQDMFGGFADALGNLFNTLTENRLANIEAEQEALEAQTERELAAAGDNDKAKSEIENRAARRQAELERQKAQAQRKAAIFDKLTSFTQAGIATALAVTKALPNIPLAIAVGIMGAINMAAIAAKQIPAFQFGGLHKGGPMIAGEKGSELMYNLDTKRLALTPNHATLMTAPKNTMIFPHEDSMRMLAASGLGVTDTTEQRTMPDNLAQSFDKFTHAYMNKREHHLHVDKNGFRRMLKHAETVTYYLKQY